MEIALKNAVVPALSIWIGVTPTTPGEDATSFCSVCSRGSLVPLGRRAQRHRDDQRPVHARAEVLRDQVIRPARRGRRRQRTDVLLAERQREQRDHQWHQDRERRQARRTADAWRSAARPPRPQPALLRRSSDRRAGPRRAVMRGPSSANTAGSSVSAARTATTTAIGRHQTHRRDQRDARHRQRYERDRDRAPGERARPHPRSRPPARSTSSIGRSACRSLGSGG